MYNWGTEILKPETTDIANVFQVVTWWSKFLLDFMNYTEEMVEANFNAEETREIPSIVPLIPVESLPEIKKEEPVEQQEVEQTLSTTDIPLIELPRTEPEGDDF